LARTDLAIADVIQAAALSTGPIAWCSRSVSRRPRR